MVKPFSLVLETGIEPVRLYGTRDFKSRASASSATRATSYIINQNLSIVNNFPIRFLTYKITIKMSKDIKILIQMYDRIINTNERTGYINE